MVSFIQSNYNRFGSGILVPGTGITLQDRGANFSMDPASDNFLEGGKKAHEALQAELEGLLAEYHDQGKEPPAAAKGMSWLKTNWKLGMEDSDRTAAGLITDGCGMGVKSLYRYLNQYQAADETSRSIARRLIRLEEQLTADMRPYL